MLQFAIRRIDTGQYYQHFDGQRQPVFADEITTTFNTMRKAMTREMMLRDRNYRVEVLEIDHKAGYSALIYMPNINKHLRCCQRHHQTERTAAKCAISLGHLRFTVQYIDQVNAVTTVREYDLPKE